MARATVAIGAVLFVVGGGALGYGLTRKAEGGMTPAMNAAIANAVSELDGDIKAARASVEQRAKTLAEFDRVRNAVSTDAATAMDMVGREIAFKPEPGEVIELGQIPKGGAPVSLIVLPAGGVRSPRSGVAGASTELATDNLLVTRTTEVVPTEGADKLVGFVTVSHLLELQPTIDRLTGAGVHGTLEINGKTRAVGTPIAGAMTQSASLASEASAKFVFAVPPSQGGTPVPVVAGGAAAAGVGLLLLILGLTVGKRKSVPSPVLTAFANTEATFSTPHLVAAGTPSPVDLQSGVTINPGTIGPGAMIGRWEVVRRLGSGGMADVFLCHSRGEAGFEKLVALKVMHSHLARNQRAVDHFLDEARLAARILHPNVVAIQDLGKIGNDYAIVMEYVDGVDLERLLASARLAGRPVPLNVALGILCRICDGLNAAHTATSPDGTPLGLIHRDVKSANVLVSKQGGVKVVDFGIAKAASQVHLTVAGETKGTPSMMAPEQRVGDRVDIRADVYSLAAVGYEVFTGHGVNLDLAALAHLGVENWPHLPPPSSLRTNLPPELDEILLTAMSFDRERRPASCAAFEATFEAVMKRHNLTANDKDISRWVESELRDIQPMPEHGDGIRKPADVM